MLARLGAGVSLIALATQGFAGTLQQDAAAFGARERVLDVAMSPSGSKLAMLVSGSAGGTILEMADLNSGQTLNLTKSDGNPQSLRWCNFAGESQLVCLHSGVEPFGRNLVNHSGLITISADGQMMKSLRAKQHFNSDHVRFADGNVIDWLPQDGGSVLMARTYLPETNTTGSILGKTSSGLGVDRIQLQSLKSTAIERPRSAASGYMTDGLGNVRLMFLEDENNQSQITGRMYIRYRTSGSKEWRDLGVYDSVRNEGWYPLAIDGPADALYALKKTNGRDALYRLKLDGSLAAETVGADASVDIDGIVRLGPGQRIIGYTYADEQRRTVYFDPEYAKLQTSLGKAIPDQPLISFQGATADGQKVLLLASGDKHAGTFYRFDKASKQLAEVAQVRPEMQGRQLASVQPIKYAASDGTMIPAYVTLPPGSSGKNLPAIVLPHGGPNARDEWGFDWLSQFLAARGYAVIQPNFRGSRGYGEAWLNENGFRGWRTSVGDVSDAAKYLVAQGIADPNRLAIVGWSYGGYAALQSAATRPELYKAVVAIAPVTDLSMVKAEARDFTDSKLVRDYVGAGAHVTEGSPLRNAASIKAPVLLIHGARDANVGVAQSDRMAAALQSGGKKVEYLKFDRLDHHLEDSDARVQMLMKLGGFLETAIRP